MAATSKDALSTPPRRNSISTFAPTRAYTSPPPTRPASPFASPASSSLLPEPARAHSSSHPSSLFTSSRTTITADAAKSVLGSPFQPLQSPLKSQIPSVPRRLLLPTTWSASHQFSSIPTNGAPLSRRSASGGGSGSESGSVSISSPPMYSMSKQARNSRPRMGRPRSDSAAASIETPSPGMKYDQSPWLGSEFSFEVAEEDVQLVGYQIHAVEKWIVERNRITTLLSVYTGDLKDKINVNALVPSSSLSPSEQDKEWQNAIQELRKEGARPRETDKGVIMVTSLAKFRSDYTVVHIPNGDFLSHREQLFVNINLLRMGCSGRSVLTLQEPSDTTKDRFISIYHFRDDIRPSPRFLVTVLEFVRLIQVGLSLFDMFSVDAEQQNGLMCDMTVEGLRTWVIDVGKPYMKVEQMERPVDSSVVSALFTVILAVRNKLNNLGLSHIAPKDPFLQPRQFTRALAAFVNQHLRQAPSASIHATVSISSPDELGIAAPAGVTHVHQAFLNCALLRRIDSANAKHRSSDAYKVHRALFSKLDDFTSATTQALATAASRSRTTSQSVDAQLTPPQPLTGTSTGGGVGARERDTQCELMDGTSDLAFFVSRAVSARGRDTFLAPSIRYLWSGRLDQFDKKRLEGLWAETEKSREDEMRERDRERSDSDEEGLGDVLSTGSGAATAFPRPWGNKVQKKIESWAERGKEFGGRVGGRGKKGSVDLGVAIKEKLGNLGGRTTPMVVVSRDGDEALSGLSSGQVSPTSPTNSVVALGMFSSGHNSAMALDENEYYRRLRHFNQLHPSKRPNLMSTARGMQIASWSDPASADELVVSSQPMWPTLNGGEETAKASGFMSPPRSIMSGHEGRMDLQISRQLSRESRTFERPIRRPPKGQAFKRSRSSDDSDFISWEELLSTERMQIDVDLAAQILIARRRRPRIEAVVAALQALVQASSFANDELRRYHSEESEVIHHLLEKSQVPADVEEAVATVDSAGLDADALLYEARSFNVPQLWRMARGPRQRVFTIRERIFGVRGQKRFSGESHGRFNRVQKTLDGRERLVDWTGRTESEVEEERDLPEIMPGEEDDGESEYDVELEVGGTAAAHAVSGTAVKDKVDNNTAENPEVKTTSAWLLEQFSRWGRVLGVRGTGTTHASVAESLAELERKKREGRDIGNENADSNEDEDEEDSSPWRRTNASRLSEIVEESEDEMEDFHSAYASKEHSRSPTRS